MARFIFSIVKFVPIESESGHYINIGAVLGHKVTNVWSLRLVDDTNRARGIDTQGVLDGALVELREFNTILSGHMPHKMPTMTEGALWELYRTWKGILRLTEPLCIEAIDEKAAVRTIFRFLVTDPFQAGPKEKKTVDMVFVLASDGTDVLRGVNRLLKQHNLTIRKKGDPKSLGDQRYLVLEALDR